AGPLSQINQPATLAAKRKVFSRLGNRLLADRTFQFELRLAGHKSIVDGILPQTGRALDAAFSDGNRLLHAVRAARLRRFIGLLQITPRLIERTLGVVVRLQRLPILVGGAFTLTGGVEYFAETDVTPHLCPLRHAIAIQAITVSIRRSLIVVLQEEHFGYAVMC